MCERELRVVTGDVVHWAADKEGETYEILEMGSHPYGNPAVGSYETYRLRRADGSKFWVRQGEISKSTQADSSEASILTK